MSARIILSAALLAVVFNGATVSAAPCLRGVNPSLAKNYPQRLQDARSVAVDELNLESREPLSIVDIGRGFKNTASSAGSAIGHTAVSVGRKIKEQGKKIAADPSTYLSRLETVASGLNTVVQAVRPRELDEGDILNLREEDLDLLEELLAREPGFNSPVQVSLSPAARRAVAKAKAKIAATLATAKRQQYIRRMGNGIKRGVDKVVGRLGGGPAASIPPPPPPPLASEPAQPPAEEAPVSARDFEDYYQLRSDEMDEIYDIIARDSWAFMDELD